MPRMPRGYGALRNPKKALYNAVYNRATVDLTKPSRSKKKTYKSKSYIPAALDTTKLQCPDCGSENQRSTEGFAAYYFFFYLVIATIAGLIIQSWLWFFILVIAAILLTILTAPFTNTYCMDCKKKYNA